MSVIMITVVMIAIMIMITILSRLFLELFQIVIVTTIKAIVVNNTLPVK